MDAEEASSEDARSGEASSIGARARFIRLRRGLSLDVAAGLAGICKQYLSMLELGQRGCNRRGLIEDIAAALGCSVADLTGQPYLPPDRASADALATLPAVSVALHECGLLDAPDVLVRPVERLAALVAEANRHVDEARYQLAGRDLGAVLTELHVHAISGTADVRRVALAALAEGCIVAAGIARPLGNGELSTLAAKRATEAAALTGRPELAGLMGMTRVGALVRLGARHRAGIVLSSALAAAEEHADPSSADTAAAEGYGMLHLTAAQLAAREGRPGEADTHLAEARQLAELTGERNAYRFHFGPANVSAWSLAIAVELERGPSVAERLDISPTMFAALNSADRRAGFHLDLSRAYAQAGGDRDTAAIRHLDTADRIAPTRLRNDPIARDLLLTLDRRARRRVWELESLRNRFGIGGESPRSVDN
ncbi:MAG TPA: helix-turn-helix transcriptional regulator [Pseudonocardiaceae bacterium]|nr:helix-turn-helix transcriptional regulator [Pseudonocardiaceae bacterium]